MSVSNKLKTDVAARDFDAIRDDLWSRITLDPNFSNGFPESWQYCLDNGIAESELYQEHDGRDINLEPTGENFDLLCGQLSTNFSKERLDKIKEIGRKLYPVNEKKPTRQTATHGAERQKSTNRESSSDSEDSGLLFAGLAIGAIAGGAIGWTIFGKAIAVGIGTIVGATVVGTAGAILSKK